MQDLLKIQGVRPTLIILIWLYIFGLFPTIQNEVQNFLSNPLVAILALIGIIQLSYHDLYLSLILAVALILSIHMSQFFNLDLGTARHNLYSNRQWKDDTNYDEPAGYNMNRDCQNSWNFQCQGVNTFGTQFNTQGMDEVQGHSKGQTFGSADI